MPRLFRVFLLLGVLLPGAACAADGASPSNAQKPLPSLKYLEKWVGKYPFNKIDGQDFWADKNVQILLKDLMGPKRAELVLTGWNSAYPSDPIDKQGDVLHVRLCKQHLCFDTNTNIFINLKTGRVDACWREGYEDRFKKPETDFWLTTGRKGRVLASSACLEDDGFELFQKYASP